MKEIASRERNGLFDVLRNTRQKPINTKCVLTEKVKREGWWLQGLRKRVIT